MGRVLAWVCVTPATLNLLVRGSIRSGAHHFLAANPSVIICVSFPSFDPGVDAKHRERFPVELDRAVMLPGSGRW